MKKLIVVLALSIALVLSLGTYAFAAGNVSLGYGFSGKNSVNGTERDTNSGLEIGFQYTVPQDQIEYGFGIDYKFEREVTNATGQKFSSIPVYGVFNYNFTEGNNAQPYFTARLGYNFFSPNDAFKVNGTSGNGLYYGVGFGVNFSQFKAEVLYTVARASITPFLAGGTKTEGDIKDIAVKFGYKF